MSTVTFAHRLERIAWIALGHVAVALGVLFLVPVLALDVWRRRRLL